jgi:hypothetical protein
VFRPDRGVDEHSLVTGMPRAGRSRVPVPARPFWFCSFSWQESSECNVSCGMKKGPGETLCCNCLLEKKATVPVQRSHSTLIVGINWPPRSPQDERRAPETVRVTLYRYDGFMVDPFHTVSKRYN